VLAVAENVAQRLRQKAAELGVPVQVVRVAEDGQLLDAADRVDAVLSTNIDSAQLRTVLRQHPSIRWVAAQSAGVDGVLVPEVRERGIAVTRVRHVHDTFVAEFAMALILAACKRLPDVVRAQQRKEWLRYQPPSLEGQTLCIAGYGEIGRALAARAKPFGMRIVGVRTRPQADGLADEVLGADELAVALRQADYVALTLPGGALRRHLIGERELRLLRGQAYLINVGRGETLDTEALDRVLREGGFAGALLDTTEVEPLPPDSPLWTNPRVVISAHVAGVRGMTFYGEVLNQIMENVRRFGRGEPLLNEVDVARGY
jgi:phosphoglycerate dehydrogenase-like enzyme